MDRRTRRVDERIGNHVRAVSIPSHDERVACDLELAERKRHSPDPVDPFPPDLVIHDVTGLGVDRVSQGSTGGIHQLGLLLCGDQCDIAEVLPFRFVNDGQDLAPLGEEDLVRILTEPKNALAKQYGKFFEMAQAQLEFTPKALLAIASKALQRDTGARALRAVTEELMLDLMYELPDFETGGKYVIDEKIVHGKERGAPRFRCQVDWRWRARGVCEYGGCGCLPLPLGSLAPRFTA